MGPKVLHGRHNSKSSCSRTQVLAFSATYTPELLADLEPLMRRPQRVMMCSETVSLLGVKQFYAMVSAEQPAAAHAGREDEGGEPRVAAGSAAPIVFRRKVQQLLRLLASVSFHQVWGTHGPVPPFSDGVPKSADYDGRHVQLNWVLSRSRQIKATCVHGNSLPSALSRRLGLVCRPFKRARATVE
jgi:hypothetical protein